MEKHYIVALSEQSPAQPRTRKPFRKGIAPFALTVTATVLSFVLLNSFLSTDTSGDTRFHLPPSTADDDVVTPLTFEWSKVVPSPDLKWHACGERRECARIELPMDHLDPFNGEKVAVGLVRIPATHKEYRGPILINPGGPGKSGILFTHAMGEIIQNIVGPEYDIVSFDQRGIGASTPKILNHQNDIERAIWRARDPPLINMSKLPDTLPLLYARADMFGKLALHAPSSHAAEHVGSVAVARDMVNITNAFGFDKVKYWGMSYASTVGGTLAAMFPDYVDRIILDGAMDISEYYSGRWMSNLEDMDKIIPYVFEACVTAGPENCPLYEPTSNEIEIRFDVVFNSLKQQPVAVFDNSTGDYAVINYANAKLVFFDALNRPFSGQMELLFEAIAALEKGNGGPMLRMLIRAPPPKCGGSTQSDVMPTQILDGAFAIRCGDSPLVDSSIEEVLEYLRELEKVSVFADLWAQIRVGCSGWRIRAKERYEGGFNKTTSFPLLVIGNTLDPVTPWAGSKKVSEGFPNSVFLTVDSPGASFLSAGMSPVAIKHIRNYFRDGILPPVGTVCPIESKLFVKNDFQTGLYDRDLKGEDREIWELARAFVQGMSEATGMDSAMNGLFL